MISNAHLLLVRHLQRPCGEETVWWAIGRLERGFDSETLRMMASQSPPYNHFALAELRDRALAELQVVDPGAVPCAVALASELLARAMRDGSSLMDVIRRFREVHMELGYVHELRDFYMLSYGEEELRWADWSIYWPDSTTETIDADIIAFAQRFVAEHPVPEELR